jgi:hypothetical protein
MFSQRERKKNWGIRNKFFIMMYIEKQIKQVFLLQFHDEMFKSSKFEGVH